ncbi:MDR family MFS transporter [Phycicoccus duodecadis]|uniref:DHA2 family lincomycin resistance protein-like MFS transporter n=1 Tax=Phycicoccus duodecadis TaxID=173053 RepID=A0A2N3YLV1_9MICO|nr:MDR family MFS transporter [Phycicoccus duodecadis]PKW27826.1 DHA2 family lincomycin resistance protein-like MFS transporter [Phycicoccus duodecadis]
MTTVDPATHTASPAASATPGERATYPVLRWLVAATFTVILNETVMVNAIPRLMAQFEVDARSAQWLSTAFMLSLAVVIPVTGWFLQRVTTRTAFAVAMSVFSVGTLVCALAPVFLVLVAGRVVQAAGTAVMMPLLMTTLMTVVAERDRGRVMGNVTLAISVAPALGPALSGVVLGFAGWRWLFGLVLPVVALVSVAGMRRLTDVGEPRVSSIDGFSVVLSALGFGGLVFGLSRIGEQHAGAVPAGVYVACGLALVGVFVLRQRSLTRRSKPLLDLRTLTHRTYALSVAMQSLAFLAMLGAMILLPLYLQDLRGLSPLQTGLLVAPGGLAMGLLGPVVGRVFDRVGARPLMVPGALGVLAALVGLSRLTESTPYALILGIQVVLMVGLAALFTPAFTLALGALPPHLYSHGSSLLATAQQVAAAVGTALTVTVLSWRSAQLARGGATEAAAYVGGVRAAFGVAAVLAIGVVVLAALLPNRAPSPDTDTDAEPAPAPGDT